jgi:hypothetical protein
MGTDINFNKSLGRTYGTRIGLPAFDPAAQAYFSATGITGATQQVAINNLVKGLKADGIWSKMKAVYPFVTDNRNLFSYTENFSNPYWIKSNVTATLSGTYLNSNFYKIADSVNGTNSFFFISSVLTAGTTYTVSANFKKGEYDYVQIHPSSYPGAVFDLVNGVIIYNGVTNATITPVGDGWYRCSITFTAAYGNIHFSPNKTSSSGYTYSGTIGYGIYMQSPQLEIGITSTTYQPIATTQQAYIAAQFKYNLVNPVDSDAAFRLVFNGGWTHSSNGATPNGTNGYADTKFNQATYLTQTNGEIGSYLRTNTTGTYVDMGCHFAGSDYALITKLADNNFYGRIATLDINSNYQPATTLGLFAVRANGTNSAKFTRNGTTQATKATTTFAIESLNIGIGSAINSTGGIYFSPRQTAFNYISDSLSDTEASNLYSRVNTFQTALSRNV